MTETAVQCYICHVASDDLVLELKQVSGGDGYVYSGDFKRVPVCANRRTCAENVQRAEESRIYSKTCGICGCLVTFTQPSKVRLLHEHLKSHTYEEMIDHLGQSAFTPWDTVVREGAQ